MRDPLAPTAPIERIRTHLVSLRMPRALEALDHIVQQLEHGEAGAIEAIETLLAEELTIRESRRIKAALQMARLTPIKTLSGFDFSFQPSLERSRVMALVALDVIDRHEVVHFIGQSGTGKSHLAIALGVEAVRAGRSVYFSPLADIIDSLARAKREGRLRERIRFLCRSSLLIIDEIGYLSVGAGAGNLFFQLVNARYERGAMILTFNRGFAEWGKVFGDPVVATALLDRLLHHAVAVHIEGAATGCASMPTWSPKASARHSIWELWMPHAGADGRRKPLLPEPPFVRPTGGSRHRGTPSVPTGSSGHGAQQRSRDETACRALRRASLDGCEHCGTYLQCICIAQRSGEFSTGTFEEISTGIDTAAFSVAAGQLVLSRDSTHMTVQFQQPGANIPGSSSALTQEHT